MAELNGADQTPAKSETRVKVIKANEGTYYDAAQHFNMWGVRKFGAPEGARVLSVSISEFLPHGGAALSASDKERIYCVLRGSITVRDEAGQDHVVDTDDMIHIAPGEKREIAVNGGLAARLLVIIADCSAGRWS